MTNGVVLMILTAALLHATWNALVKGAGDRPLMLGLISAGHVVSGAGILALVGSPGWVVLPYVVGSTVLHAGYYWMLNLAYRTTDLSVAYPIARGMAPVLIALGAQLWIGETLPPAAWVGILCVSAGIMVLSRGVLKRGLPAAGLAAAVGTGLFIAAYSLVDGVGVRTASTALGYIGWLFVAELVIVAYIFPTRLDRLRALSAKTVWLGVLGGVISGLAYGLVLYAKTLAPLGVVSALRETSVIFAALFGVYWFGEGPRVNRMVAAMIVAGGIVMIGAAG